MSAQSITTGRIHIVQMLSLLLSLQPADRIARDKRINAQPPLTKRWVVGENPPDPLLAVSNTQFELTEGMRFFLLSSDGFSQVPGQDKNQDINSWMRP